MKYFFQVTILLILFSSCKDSSEKVSYKSPNTFSMYSKKLDNHFTIFVSLPKNYEAHKGKIPVVYLLDANLYFDMMAPIIKKYTEVGLPPVILVGIGYKDFATMDSLRDRDYTFPAAIPGSEMKVSGNGDKFLAFIEQELIPEIDAKYPNDKNKRILMGHSLGGFFTMYALQQNLVRKNNTFKDYIAASPSMEYNHHYLLNELNKTNPDAAKTTKVYVTYGSLEDEEENNPARMKSNDILLSLNQSLKDKINYKGDMYSNFGHMETPLPTFFKGLVRALDME